MYPSSGNTPLRRYVHGPSEDDPLIWYEGGTMTAGNANYLIPDRQGSVVATASTSGALAVNYTYDPYGVPNTWGTVDTVPRFRYTGQAALPEARLYYYKARVYDPGSGKFLQTDPEGYGPDLNWYVYLGGDPIDESDPLGLCQAGATATGASQRGHVTVISCSDRLDEWRSGGTLAWRNNNPANLTNSWHHKFYGSIGSYDNQPLSKLPFAIFSDLDTGTKAAVEYNRRNAALDIDQLISKRSPSDENNTARIQRNVRAAVGVPGSATLSKLTPGQAAKLVTAIAVEEGFKAGTVSFKQNSNGTATFSGQKEILGSRLTQAVHCTVSSSGASC